MDGRKKVAIVILGWNGKKFLEQFLPSVTRFSKPELCNVIVADNMSTDGSVKYVIDNFPGVEIIQNNRNGGYAGGYNDALKRVEADYYVLLNQDVEVTPGWIEAVIAEMDKDKNIAAAQPKIRAFTQKDYFEYAGACGGYLDRFGYAYCRGRIFDTLEKDEEQYDNVTDIFWATGACLFIRSDIYWKAGGLDEDFFAHQEEIDLCWRINNMGYRIICVPQSVVYHVGGGSLPQGNPRKTYLNFRNNLMMMFKNLPMIPALFKIAMRIVLDLLAAFQSILKNKNLADFTAIIKAHFAFYAAIPALLRKRKSISKFSSNHLSGISVVWAYFINGKKKFSEL